MKPSAHGRGTSPVEVTNISADAVWLLIDGSELFMPYDEFPHTDRANKRTSIHPPRSPCLLSQWPVNSRLTGDR